MAIACGSGSRGDDHDARLVQRLFGRGSTPVAVRAVLSRLVSEGRHDEFRVGVAYLDLADIQPGRPPVRL